MDPTTTTTLAFADIDYSLIVYCLGALLIGGGGAYYIMKTDRMITAVGFLLASIAIFVYFGLRWFDGFKLRQEMAGSIDPKTPWPPLVNFCPDFLSLVKSGTNFYCVDTTGVSTLPKYTGTIQVTAGANSPVNVIPLAPTKTAMEYVTNSLMTTGITWEGIYDGRSASTRKIPFPA